jgi:hypothetical protein
MEIQSAVERGLTAPLRIFREEFGREYPREQY